MHVWPAAPFQGTPLTLLHAGPCCAALCCEVLCCAEPCLLGVEGAVLAGEALDNDLQVMRHNDARVALQLH